MADMPEHEQAQPGEPSHDGLLYGEHGSGQRWLPGGRPRPAGVVRLIGGRRWALAGVAMFAALAVALVVLVVVSGEGLSDAHRPPLASAGRQLTRDPAARPLSVPSQPSWRGGVGGFLSEADGAQIAGDRVLLWGNTAAEESQNPDDDLAVADLTTGRPVWIWHYNQPKHTADGRRLFLDPSDDDSDAVLVGTGTDALVLTLYVLTDCPSEPGCSTSGTLDERGLMALDAATGAVRWRTPILPSVSMNSPRADALDFSVPPWLVAADEQTAVIGIDNKQPGDRSVRTVVIDVATGTVRWRRDGEWPQRLTGDTVLTERSLVANPHYGGEPGDLGLAVDVTARDAGSGAVRWHTAGRYRRAGLLAAAGGVALLWHSTAAPKTDGRYQVVDVKTGKVRASMTAHTPSTLGDDNPPCADQDPSDPTLLACLVVTSPNAGVAQTQRLWTAQSGQVGLSPPIHVQATTLQVADGYVLAGSPAYQQGWIVLDRAGRRLAQFDGTVLALNDGYAVVRTSTDAKPGYGIYHLGH